jgi:hypothetical protein
MSTLPYPPITDFKPTLPVVVQSLPLLPVTQPPLPQHLPPLPSQPRRLDSGIDLQYQLTTHLVPAAYPRLTPHISVQPPAWSSNRETWSANVNKATQEVMQWNTDLHGGKLLGDHGSTKVLWNCLNRYTRRSRPQNRLNNTGLPLTLLFSHANGFPKEVCVASH